MPSDADDLYLASRRAQGLPDHVTDAAVIRQIAALLDSATESESEVAA